MGLQIDWENQLILVTSPTTDVDAQVLHDFIEDEMASPVGMSYADIQKPEGKIEDPAQPGVYSQIIMEINSPWQIQFWGGSGYTRIYGGKIVGGLSNEPMKATGTAGDITVLESPVDGLVVVSGSGVTPQDKTDIIDGVWDKDLSGYAAGADTAGAQLVVIRKINTNKLELADGAGNNLVLYDDNGSTYLIEWPERDKSDGNITSPAGIPAKRGTPTYNP